MTGLNGLTSLERVRDWVGASTNNDDILLSRLIDEMSRLILSYLQRPVLFSHSFNELQDGNGRQRQIMRHWPVQAVISLTIDNIAIPVSTNGSAGYIVEPWDGFPPGRPQAINLRGYSFTSGFGNVSITYTAGFSVINESQQVPNTGNYSLAVYAPYGSYGVDIGVSYVNEMPLTSVTGEPAQGQYNVSNGIYTFNAMDAGTAVLISYSYIPADIEHACVELVGERYRYKNRIGEVSKSLGGQETVSYSQKDIPDFVKILLQPYRRMILV